MWCFVRCGGSDFGASTRRREWDNRVAELLFALRDSWPVSLIVPSGHHVEVGARRPPTVSYISPSPTGTILGLSGGVEMDAWWRLPGGAGAC